MLFNSCILAISSSIDSLGIGITYGIRNIKISSIGQIILFIISFSITFISIYCGNIIKNIFTETVTNIIGSSILILVGIFICFSTIKKDKKISPQKRNIFKEPAAYDFDNSKIINFKESIFLAVALSLDSFCIGIGGSIAGININFFPLTISIFQLLFINLGSLLGNKLHKLCILPNNIWSIISGIALVFIGLIKLI